MLHAPGEKAECDVDLWLMVEAWYFMLHSPVEKAECDIELWLMVEGWYCKCRIIIFHASIKCIFKLSTFFLETQYYPCSEVNKMADVIKEYQKWRSHVHWMPNYRLPRRVLNYRPRGKRDLGRP
jgi:hypothetical protein